MTLANVPAELRSLTQWVVWKNILRDDRLTKIPYQVSGEAASSTNSATWSTFDRAQQAYGVGNREYSGVGFVFAADGGLCGIDLDGCRDHKTGEVVPWAREWIVAFDSYSEVSPSATGVKIWVRGTKPTWCGAKASVEAPMIGEKSPAVEMYDRGRYFAVTGQRLAGLPTEPQERQAVIERFAEAFWKRPEYTAPEENRDFGSEAAIADRAAKYISRITAVSGQDGHGATFNAACSLVKGFGLERGIALTLLRQWNQTNATPPWNEKELAHKIDGACKAKGETNYLRLARPQTWAPEVCAYKEPKAEVTANEVKIPTLADASLNYLDRVTSGKQVFYETGIPDLDYAIGGGVELNEMFVLAARPSHGKSLVAMQMVHAATANGMPSLIISEEMSQLAIGKRAIQFASPIPREHWKTRSRDVVRDLSEHFADRSTCYVAESVGTAARAVDVIREHVDKYGVRLVAIDYAQLLRGEGKSRYEQVTNTSIMLRSIASSLPIVLVALCQLNRDVEKRPKFLPQNSDLKDSGQIEQDADVIVHLCWPHKLNASNPASDYLMFIGKNRNRETNIYNLRCTFKPSRQMLVDTKPQQVEGVPSGRGEWSY